MQNIDMTQLDEEARRDYESKQKEQELLQQQFEKELERKTELYRKAQEAEADIIRKELEKQHIRDVEFRKELVEHAIENQKRQIDIESKYAKKELGRERSKARSMLERQKFHSDIQVRNLGQEKRQNSYYYQE
nr:CAHS 8a [Paramacrobiotus areolatus]